MSMKKTRVHLRRQTWVAKNGEVAKGWRIVDASGVPLGRLAQPEVSSTRAASAQPRSPPC